MCASFVAPCVFLDRDGTIIYDKHYLCDPAAVELLPAAAEGLTLLQAAGCALVVLSNQSGIGRGYFDAASVDAVNARMDELLRARGVRLTGVVYCPHGPDEHCSCRKPAPGLALKAARLWNLEGLLRDGHCVSVGDKMSDVRLGQSLGGRGVLVLTGKGTSEARVHGPKSTPGNTVPGQAHTAPVVRAHSPLHPDLSDPALPNHISPNHISPNHISPDLRDAAHWILNFRQPFSG